MERRFFSSICSLNQSLHYSYNQNPASSFSTSFAPFGDSSFCLLVGLHLKKPAFLILTFLDHCLRPKHTAKKCNTGSKESYSCWNIFCFTLWIIQVKFSSVLWSLILMPIFHKRLHEYKFRGVQYIITSFKSFFSLPLRSCRMSATLAVRTISSANSMRNNFFEGQYILPKAAECSLSSFSFSFFSLTCLSNSVTST